MSNTRRQDGFVAMCARLMLAVLAMTMSNPVAAIAQATDEVTYYHTDAIGSVRMITSASQVEVVRHDYLPFGERWTGPDVPDARRFVGKERDTETGFDYSGARHYVSGSGRFTTVDPVMEIETALTDPQRWNRYAYALNRPYRYVDPDGANPILIKFAELAQRAAASPAAQRAQQVIVSQGSRAWVALTRLFSSTAGQETIKTAAELATGLDAGPSTLGATGLANRAAARAALSELGDVGAAANRFFRGATAKSTDFRISELSAGLRRLEFFSPANNAGYGKRYVQEVDAFGRVVREYKETISPSGVIDVKWIRGERLK